MLFYISWGEAAAVFDVAVAALVYMLAAWSQMAQGQAASWLVIGWPRTLS